MRKIIGFFSNSKAVGMDGVEAFLFADNTSDDDIFKEVYHASCEWVENWFTLVDECSDDEDDDKTIFPEEVEAWWEDYDPEKHDCLKAGGGSFTEDFERLAR
jgi:hypothetical protein